MRTENQVFSSYYVNIDPSIFRVVSLGTVILIFISMLRSLIFSVTGYLINQFNTQIPIFIIALLPTLNLLIPNEYLTNWKLLLPVLPPIWLFQIWINDPWILIISYVLTSSIIFIILPNLLYIQLKLDEDDIIIQSILLAFGADIVIRGINNGIDPVLYSNLLPKIIFSIFVMSITLFLYPKPIRKIDNSFENNTDYNDVMAIWTRYLGILGIFFGLLTYTTFFANAGILYQTFNLGQTLSLLVYNPIMIIIIIAFSYFELTTVDKPNWYYPATYSLFLISTILYPWNTWKLIFLPIAFFTFLILSNNCIKNVNNTAINSLKSIKLMIFVGTALYIAFTAILVQYERFLLLVTIPFIFLIISVISKYLSEEIIKNE